MPTKTMTKSQDSFAAGNNSVADRSIPDPMTRSAPPPEQAQSSPEIRLLDDVSLFTDTSADQADGQQKPEPWTVNELTSLTEKIAPGRFKQVEEKLGYRPEVKLKKRLRFRGFWNPPRSANGKGDIHISKGLTLEEAAQVLVMELGNALRTEDFSDIDDNAEAGDLSEEEYVKQIEHTEFVSRLETIEAWRAGKISGDLSEECIFMEDIDTFEAYWDKVKDTDHAELYREYWRTNYQAAYEKKQKGK
jgi:hypothetical protein